MDEQLTFEDWGEYEVEQLSLFDELVEEAETMGMSKDTS